MFSQRIKLASIDLEHLKVNEMDVEKLRADLVDFRDFVRGEKQRVAVRLTNFDEHKKLRCGEKAAGGAVNEPAAQREIDEGSITRGVGPAETNGGAWKRTY